MIIVAPGPRLERSLASAGPRVVAPGRDRYVVLLAARPVGRRGARCSRIAPPGLCRSGRAAMVISPARGAGRTEQRDRSDLTHSTGGHDSGAPLTRISGNAGTTPSSCSTNIARWVRCAGVFFENGTEEGSRASAGVRVYFGGCVRSCYCFALVRTTNVCSGASRAWAVRPVSALYGCRPLLFGGLVSDGEFDPGSGRTLAACLTHASRAAPIWWQHQGRCSGERVSNT